MVSCRVVSHPLERDGSFQYQSSEQSPSANIDTEDLNVHFIPGRTGVMCLDLLKRQHIRWGTVSDSHCVAGACQDRGEVIGIAMCSWRRNTPHPIITPTPTTDPPHAHTTGKSLFCCLSPSCWNLSFTGASISNAYMPLSYEEDYS